MEIRRGVFAIPLDPMKIQIYGAVHLLTLQSVWCGDTTYMHIYIYGICFICERNRFIWCRHHHPMNFELCCTVNCGFAACARSFLRRIWYADVDGKYPDIRHRGVLFYPQRSHRPAMLSMFDGTWQNYGRPIYLQRQRM